MKRTTLFLGIGLLLLSFGLQAQEKTIGIMLHRIAIADGYTSSSHSIAMLQQYTKPSYPKSETDYSKEENFVIDMISKALSSSFAASGYTPNYLRFEGLTEEERLTEQNFFIKIQTDLGKQSNPFMSKKKRKATYTFDKTIRPLANIFAAKLSTDLLVFFEFYFIKKKYVSISAYLVDGKSGKLITYKYKAKTGKSILKNGKEKNTTKLVNKLVDKLIKKVITAYEESLEK